MVLKQTTKVGRGMEARRERELRWLGGFVVVLMLSSSAWGGTPAGPLVRVSSTPGAGVGVEAHAPATAFDGAGYLAVWAADGVSVGREVYARRLAPDGLPLVLPFTISDMALGGQALDRMANLPDVACNLHSGVCLVVWEGDGVSNPDGTPAGAAGQTEIFGALVDLTASITVSPQFQISAAGDGGPDRDAQEPAVAYDPASAEFLVVWRGDGKGADDEFQIWGRRLDSKGRFVDNAFPVSDRIPTDLDRPGHPAVTYDVTHDQYLVVWHLQGPAGGGVAGRRVDAAPSTFGPIDPTDVPIPGAGAGAFRPDVVFNVNTGEFVVVWEDGSTLLPARRLDAALNVKGSFQVAAGSYVASPAVASGGSENGYLFTWTGTTGTVSEVWALHTNGRGQGVEPPFAVTAVAALATGSEDRDALTPAVAASGLDASYLAVCLADGVVDPDPTVVSDADVREVFASRLGVDGAPVAVTDTASTPEDTQAVIDVLANDTDPEGGVLTVSGVGVVAHGAVTNNGTSITYTPDPDYAGYDVFWYTVSDGTGSNSAVVQVTVTAVNDPPVMAVNTGASVFPGGTVGITATALSATDPDDGPAGLTYTVTVPPPAGRLENTGQPGTAITSFTQADVNAGVVQYVHDGSAVASDGFSFSLADGGENGSSPVTGVFSITIRRPDLVVSAISVGSSVIVYGATPSIGVTFEVKNQGAVAVPAGTLYARKVNVTRDGTPEIMGGFFSVPNIPPLVPGAAVAVTFAVGHDSNWPVGTYDLQIEVDYDDAVLESDETNNVSAVVHFDVVTGTAPDLVVSSGAPVLDTPVVEAGRDIVLEPWTVKNQGGTPTGVGWANGYYLSTDSVITTTDTYLDGNANAAFGAGAWFEWGGAMLVIPPSIPPGNYYFGILVDYAGAVAEGDETNNYVSVPLQVVAPKPDLTVSGFGIASPVVIDGATPSTPVTIDITNTGLAPLSGTALRGKVVNRTRNGQPFGGTGWIPLEYTGSIGPGQTVHDGFQVIGTSNGWPVGTYVMQFMVDDVNAVVEFNETNNVSGSITFNVVTGPDPDLVVLTGPPTLTPAAVLPGGTFELGAWTIKNQGGSTAVPSATGYYLSTDTTVSPDDVRLGGVGQRALTAGSQDDFVPISWAMASGKAPGDYFVLIVLDENAVVAEGDETNNLVWSPLTVLDPRPDLVVSNVTAPVGPVVYGDQPASWVTYEVRNDGNVPVTGVTLHAKIVDRTRGSVPSPVGGDLVFTYTDPLQPGETATNQFAVGHEIQWSPGFYTFQIEVDSDNVVDEIREDNNRSAKVLVLVVAPPVIAELAGADGTWAARSLSAGMFADPVLIVGPPTQHDPDPGVIQVRGVGPTGYELKFAEWSYLDGVHGTEAVRCLVLDAGVHRMPDGSIWQVGRVPLSGHGAWTPVTLPVGLAGLPTVFLTSQTANSARPAAVRVRNVTSSGFEAALFGEEARAADPVAETVGYLAVYAPVGSGTVTLSQGVPFPFTLTTVSVDSGYVFAGVGVALRLQEEASLDVEILHPAETMNTLRLGGSIWSAQEVSGTDPDTVALRWDDLDTDSDGYPDSVDDDDDNDGLTDVAEAALGTDRLNPDTDGDGVIDGTDAFPLDPAASVDTDGDGYPDVWNPGMTRADSTTGLTLDFYPGDPRLAFPPNLGGVYRLLFE